MKKRAKHSLKGNTKFEINATEKKSLTEILCHILLHNIFLFHVEFYVHMRW